MTLSPITFKVIRDGSEFIVADASVAGASFAMVPKWFSHAFDTRAAAQFQADDLNKAKTRLETRMIETPDRFEAAADTKYGPAWE